MKFNELADRIIKENIKIAKSFEDRLSEMLPNNQLPTNPIHQRAILGQLVTELGYEKDPEQLANAHKLLRGVFGDAAVDKQLAQHAKDKDLSKQGAAQGVPAIGIPRRSESEERFRSRERNA